MRVSLYGSLLLLVAFLMHGCSPSPTVTKPGIKTVKVTLASMNKTLHFSGNIQPIYESSLISPVDAVIEAMPVHYGQELKKNDLVFRLNSADLQKQYNDTLTEYLKIKDSFLISQSKFQGAEDLYEAGILSKNAYLSEKSNLDNARMSMLQSRQKFSSLMRTMGNSAIDWSDLSLSDFDKVQKAMAGNHQIVSIRSPHAGIVLYPPKSSDDKGLRLGAGTTVKKGQVLALIGDLSGVRIDIDIPEIDIDKVQRGMSATIEGIALADHVLKGSLVAVNGQASPNSRQNLPVFNAVVEVKSLSPEQKKRIRVGMSATVKLPLDSNQQLVIPIKAVRFERGKSLVKVIDKNGKITVKEIKTGSASQDTVVVQSGLKEGEELVLNESTASH